MPKISSYANGGAIQTSDQFVIARSGLNYSILGGSMVIGRHVITPSVAANDLTVALKTLSGGTPSATDPLSFRVGNFDLQVTGALSITLVDGTQWFNLDTRFAAQEVDFFVYIGRRASDGSAFMVFARIPYAETYGDFSTTNTNEKYGPSTGAAPASTDPVVNIGRFAATLSATASYNWSVPAFTGTNLINHPIYETRQLSYIPAWSGNGTPPAIGTGTIVGQYHISGRRCAFWGVMTTDGTSTYGTSTLYRWTSPFTSAAFTSGIYLGSAQCFDTSGTAYFPSNAYMGASAALINATSASGLVRNTVPFTWASGDSFSWQMDTPIA